MKSVSTIAITLLGLLTLSISAQAHVCKVVSIRAVVLEKDSKLAEATVTTLSCNSDTERMTAIVRSQGQLTLLNSAFETKESVRIGIDEKRNLTEIGRNVEGFN